MNQKCILKKYRDEDLKMYRRANSSFNSQVDRCTKPTAQRFNSYGAKGLAVSYTKIEFIEWWFLELKTRKKWTCPTVGRIDHTKGYSFGNIRLEEKSENSKERIARCGTITPPREIEIFKDDYLVFSAKSMQEAARWSGATIQNISYVCLKRRKTAAGFTFKYKEAVCL